MEELITYYNDYNEDSRLVRQNTTRIEFDTTTQILKKYLHVSKRITELGAGTGRYSIYYALLGHNVIAVELVESLINTLRINSIKDGANLKIFQGNSISVPFIEDDSQDIVLILGPLYHQRKIKDRMATMSEAQRILKKGGIVAIAYINKFFIAGLFAKYFPQLVSKKILSELIETGRVNNKNIERFFRVGYFSSPDEMDHFVSKSGFCIQEHIALDGIGKYIAESVDSFDEEKYQIWLEYHLKTCHEKCLLGTSNHGMVIAIKN